MVGVYMFTRIILLLSKTQSSSMNLPELSSTLGMSRSFDIMMATPRLFDVPWENTISPSQQFVQSFSVNIYAPNKDSPEVFIKIRDILEYSYQTDTLYIM